MLSKTISMDIRPFGYAVVTNDGRVLISNEGSLFIFPGAPGEEDKDRIVKNLLGLDVDYPDKAPHRLACVYIGEPTEEKGALVN